MKSLREYALDYLYHSGFVAALVKKSLYNSLIDDYLDDYISEVWIAILELKDDVWEKLYKSAIEKGKDYEYELRNYVSRIIFNTVKSTSSNAYRKLIKHNATELQRNQCQWDVMSNSIADSTEITDTIQSLNDQETVN
jgi:hypothetical protein